MASPISSSVISPRVASSCSIARYPLASHRPRAARSADRPDGSAASPCRALTRFGPRRHDHASVVVGLSHPRARITAFAIGAVPTRRPIRRSRSDRDSRRRPLGPWLARTPAMAKAGVLAFASVDSTQGSPSPSDGVRVRHREPGSNIKKDPRRAIGEGLGRLVYLGRSNLGLPDAPREFPNKFLSADQFPRSRPIVRKDRRQPQRHALGWSPMARPFEMEI